jgi:predicted nucleic acid-binding Zn ribbon protein
MKTTLEIPDAVFRRAKAKAAERGQALRVFVTEALQEKLSGRPVSASDPAPWMKGFGQLRTLRRETARIQRVIDREFEVVEPEDRR